MIKTFAAPVLALALIGALVLERQSWPQPEDASDYHARVAEAIRAVPDEIDGWASEPVELPQAAVTLLRPNEILSRRYRDPETGRSFQWLIIHCLNARDMVGHYPPRCYPANGWQMISSERRPESTSPAGAAHAELPRVDYTFEQHLPGASARLNVANLIVLPDGTFGHTMRDVNRIAADRQLRVYGAAQMQFVFHGDFSGSEREQIVQTFTAAAHDAVQAIRTGAEK